MGVKGIFRIRGKIKEVKEFKERLDAGEDIEESAWLNIHVTSTLMKAFLRELPVPILLFDNYSIFMNTFDLKGEEQIDALKKLFSSLPENNYNLLMTLFSILNELSENSEQTQMNAENLAKVISPNL